MDGNLTWIDTELDAQCRLISFLLLKKIIVGQKKNNLVLKEMNYDLMEQLHLHQTSASAPGQFLLGHQFNN